jgi:hypothetical protein
VASARFLAIPQIDQFAYLSPSRQESILSYVLASANVSYDGIRHGAHGRLVPFHQYGKGGAVAGAGSPG